MVEKKDIEVMGPVVLNGDYEGDTKIYRTPKQFQPNNVRQKEKQKAKRRAKNKNR